MREALNTSRYGRTAVINYASCFFSVFGSQLILNHTSFKSSLAGCPGEHKSSALLSPLTKQQQQPYYACVSPAFFLILNYSCPLPSFRHTFYTYVCFFFFFADTKSVFGPPMLLTHFLHNVLLLLVVCRGVHSPSHLTDLSSLVRSVAVPQHPHTQTKKKQKH